MSTGIPYSIGDSVAGMPTVKRKPAKTAREIALSASSATAPATGPLIALTVGDRVRLCREAKGLKKAQVARALRVSAAAAGDWENGNTKQPTGANLLNMRDALGYNIDFIVRGKGMPLLPNFEDMARESALISIFRDLQDGPKKSLLEIAQQLRRAHGGGPTNHDPFPKAPPVNPEDH
jgi:transcriptional regulator with XRE-family HTH domain